MQSVPSILEEAPRARLHELGVKRIHGWLCAGAYFAGQGVRYLCVAGAAVQGDRAAPRRSVQRYAHAAYSQARRLPRTEPATVLWPGHIQPGHRADADS